VFTLARIAIPKYVVVVQSGEGHENVLKISTRLRENYIQNGEE
jgi:hypothetical protein